MTRWMHPPELKRQRAGFDPIVEGNRHGLSRELSLATWARVCADTTDSAGRRDEEQAWQRFYELAVRVAARGGRLHPDIGRVTRVGLEIDGDSLGAWSTDDERPRTPGRETLVIAEARRWAQGNGAHSEPPARRMPEHGPHSMVAPDGGTTADADLVHAAAAEGVRGASSALPHAAAIQASFGHHDVGGVRAHVGGAAAEAAARIGARAYATGDDVAFAAAPDLRQAAHEAAHVVQQRGGVRLDGGVGRAGDPYEQHADAVADRVMRGASAEALLDTMAHHGAAGGPAVQRLDRDGDGIDDDRWMVGLNFTYIPREVPTPAGRQLQTALMSRIPAERRDDIGQVLLKALPALASILDPGITAARDADLIVSRSSAWHPASYEGDGIPTPYKWALWDYYKARWESEDRATRRAHLDLAHSHWHDLMLPRNFGNRVRTDAGAVRNLIRSLIESPATHLRSDRTFDVLSHDGNALTPEERAARAAATPAAASGSARRGGTTGRSETMDVRPEDVVVTDGEPRTVRYVNPDALRFVPHFTSGSRDPRRAAFDGLAALLRERMAAADGAARATIDARIETESVDVRERMRVYVRRNRHGPERDSALATIDTVALTTDVEVRSHDVDVGMFRVHLEPVDPGSLIERPGGFRAEITDRATGRGASGHASEEVMTEVVSSFSGDQQVIARQYLEVIRRAEGSLTSLNTWDRVRITLGSGVGAAGRLQDRFAMFERDDPEAYERIFGRHGIDVDAHGLHGDRGSGNSEFRTTGDGGEALVGTEATEEMANDPATLAIMATAGFDPAWQRFLLQGGVNSLQRAFAVTFTRRPDGAVVLAENGGGIAVYDWLPGHVSSTVLAAAMFSMADDFHGSGHLASATEDGFGPQYQAAMDAAHADAAHPESAPAAARGAVATWLVRERSHARRRTHIAAALGVASFDAITGS